MLNTFRLLPVPPLRAGLHFTVWVFGAGFDEGDFIRGEVEEGVHLPVEVNFVADDLLGELLMLLPGIGQIQLPLVPLFEGDVLFEHLLDFIPQSRKIQLPPRRQRVTKNRTW